MLEPLLNSTTLPMLEKLAVFGERRHEVLSGNIANIDTPGYKTRDLPVDDFQQALRSAVMSRHRPSPGNPSSAVESQFPQELFGAIEAQPKHLTFQDGGNRSIEHEVMEMTKNSMLQGFALDLLTAQLRLLETVIQERP